MALIAAGEQVEDPAQKSKLRKAATAVAGLAGGIAEDLATKIATAYLARISGLP